ncbi:hypothetical protein Pla123a_09980 [Posidoniimonas polymericola]|uniref:Pectate lyase n=1 Tax=Posidoniimonas polymericola TaxID=2528002 RepID=A0A5C5YTC9_9BACT|nr:hypothetical protein [Posidoniimonas polymericola]TWT78208.1 hypothetical protein Pla123a_09980 [Posidoniimonas polymericola]
MRFIVVIALAVEFVLASAAHAAAGPPAAPAFPGALGQGAASAGGRGGAVYHVTTLEDYAPHRGEEKIKGSLRHAFRADIGPRTVVFDVAGVIHLKEPLEIQKDRITVAGQTSPGGVTLFGYPLEVSGAKDIVVRHLRVRCSDLHGRPAGEVVGQTGVSRGDLVGSKANSVHIGNGAERVIFDHVSATWAIDETLSVTEARDVTVQHCLIAEALDHSLHSKGAHGYGTLVRGGLSADDRDACRGGYTFLGNLWAHNRSRNPSLGGEQRIRNGLAESARGSADVNLLNNVVYNWSDQATYRSELGMVRINLIANSYITGPAKHAKYFFRGGGAARGIAYSPTLLYARGNLFDRDEDDQYNGLPVESTDLVDTAITQLDHDDTLRTTGDPFAFLDPATADAIQPAEDAYQQVVRGAGASLWRDAIDTRIIDSLIHHDGRVIDSQEEFRGADGVLPGVDDLAEQRRPGGFDADQDGIADDYERAHQLDPANPADAGGDSLAVARGWPGLTNLEVYLHDLTRGE